MSAYYNEHDPFAAKWLRELIKAGHIADGEVDERSIEDVLPSDLAGFTQCHFFAGIGVWSYALKQAGWPDEEPVWTGSCPCQPFSTAGKRAGIADERHLWPSWFHLIAQCCPPVIFGEQVEAAVRQGWLDLVQADLEGLDYACGPVGIPAAGFGAPHARQRLYFVADTERGRRECFAEQRRSCLLTEVDGSTEPQQPIGPYNTSSCPDGDVADASNPRCHEQRPAEAAALQGQCTERGREHPQPGHDEELSRRPEGLRGTSSLGNTESARRQLHIRSGYGTSSEIGQQVNNRRTAPQADKSSSYGATNGFWAAADWLWCRDQKYRPVEPGTFPLAHGSPNRVGRLRGYGNAIVAPQAEAFIRAYIETRQQQEGN